MTHPLEAVIYSFLQSAANHEDLGVPDALYEEFGKRCMDGLKKQLTRDAQEFSLRMSNIGKDTRQLMLEKKYGRGIVSPDFILKMLDGDLQEALIMFLMKASGITVLAQEKEVILKMPSTSLTGTFDVKLKYAGEKVWDVKTASPYSYANKFMNWETLAKSDDFGYMAQGFGYAAAEGVPFGGWIVKNKATGELKVIEIPDEVHDDLSKKYLTEIEYKINYINDPKSKMPECQGVCPETHYKKPSGNLILGNSCKYCPHKEKCHPEIQYLPKRVGKGSSYEWYVKIGDDKDA